MSVNLFFGIRQQKYHVNNHLNSRAKTKGTVTSGNQKLWANHIKSAEQINEKPTAHIASDKKKTFTGKVAQYFKQYLAARFSNVKRQRDVVMPSRTTETLGVLEKHFISAATSAMLALGRDPSSLLDQTHQKLHVENRALTKQDLQRAKTLKPLLIDGLMREFINQGFTKKEAKIQAKQAFAAGLREVLNAQKWETIDTRFQHNNVHYQCTLTPAAQMKQGEYGVFLTPYNDQGIVSSSSQETAHVTNLWLSEFSALGEKGTKQRLFTGIRHGILSPFGLAKNSDARYFGAQTRAMEVVTAALFARPELLRDAEQGKTVALNLASTSLVTGGRGDEKDMMDDQMQAWALLSQQQPLQVPLRDAQGNIYHASINLNVAAFNFGVNVPALIGNIGWKQADGYNEVAMKTLVGNDLSVTAPPKGWVGDYLSQHPSAENAQKVRTLSQQLKAIWANKTHHRDDGEPYKAALRVALLANEIGVMPCWNCKSGKDRTGMLDAEIKRETVKMHQHDTGVMKQTLNVSLPGSSLNSAEQQLLQTILLHGGNKEVQQYNTGAPGNKVARSLPTFLTLSTRQRIGDEDAFNNTRGLSELV